MGKRKRPEKGKPVPVSKTFSVQWEALQGVSATATVQCESLAVHSFAPEWYEECRREAKNKEGRGTEAYRRARQREIIFAVCLAESYLFEWMRDEVLKGDSEKLQEYFPPKPRCKDDPRFRRTLKEKWKEIPQELLGDGLIPAIPDFGGPHGAEWKRLLKYRNGLIHAAVSRPKASVKEEEPSYHTLKDLKAGWALGVVVERIKRLHEAAGAPMPSWLKK